MGEIAALGSLLQDKPPPCVANEALQRVHLDGRLSFDLSGRYAG
jgi:hypothetical protein